MAVQLDGIRQKVFLDRYALKDKTGKLLEHTPEEMWRRVARGIAANEKKSEQKKWEEAFYKVMEDFKFVPAGRILSGAGTEYQVTYFNCFVIPNPKDSRHGILESLGQLVEIQARSGGVGLNLSSLRPKGARVRKVNGTSSGPVNWATLFSVATHDIVQQGGSRRGATMLMLWDWHPDIEEFITVKEDLSKINGANLSVCISDAFMEAVKNDADWDLVYPDINDPDYDEKWDGEIDKWRALGKPVITYKTVKARYLWDLICTAAWRSAEPGLHFLERSNKQSNTYWFERLIATNPCLPADTWIHTSYGPRQIRDLLNEPFVARVNGKNYLSTAKGFFKTGTKQVLTLQTKEGYSLRLTQDHKIRRVSRFTRHTVETDWSEAGQLRPGDWVLLHNHQDNVSWKGSYTFHDGYLVGLLVSDGALNKNKSVLSVWETRDSNYESAIEHVVEPTSHLGKRLEFVNWTLARKEHHVVLSAAKKLALELGIASGAKTITKEIEEASSDFYKGFLRGLFDANGSVEDSPQKGVHLRLSEADLSFLEAVQRMLLRLGIVSVISQNRRLEKSKDRSESRRNKTAYPVKSGHELVIRGENVLQFAQLIDFGDSDKSDRLQQLLSSYKKTLKKERFVAQVDSITVDGVEDVYDATILQMHAFDANGFYVHNCGEQPLGAWAVCNLGAMNLAAYVHDEKFDFESFGKDVRIALRMLDNVIDQTYYFFKENEKCAKDIRRTGLGIMGLGDALIKMKLPYGSDRSIPVIEKIFQTLRDNAYEASSDLAKEKGSFPLFDKEKYLNAYFVKKLPRAVRKKIAEQGIRNAVLLTIAPTGTTSLIAGVSSGIEPVYEFSFKRKWRGGEEIMYHPLYDKWRKEHEGEEKPDYFVAANDLTPMEHVRVQAVAQQYIDSSISKTVNAPNSHTVEDVKKLYMYAYDYGLKGITYMRDGSRMGVLERLPEKKEEVKESKPIVPVTTRIPRPMVLSGITYKADSPIGRMYVTINHDEAGQPFEVFINNGKSGSDVMAMADALGRMISFVLRIHSPVPQRERMREIVSELTGIGGSRSVGFGENRVRSLPDAVARVLAKHGNFRINGKAEDKPVVASSTPSIAGEPANTTMAIHGNGLSASQTVVNGQASFLTKVDQENSKGEQLGFVPQSTIPVEAVAGNTTNITFFDICPECGAASFAYEEGCKKCYSCGYSEC